MFLSVRILDFKKIEDAIGKVYVVYRLLVSNGAIFWVILRRYSQFHKLHKKLSSFIPRKEIVGIPEKIWWGNMEDNLIQRRMKELQNYLVTLLQFPIIQESVDFMSFVGALSTTWSDHVEKTGITNEIIHLNVLQKALSIGDIILFQSCDSLSALQRSMTNAQWDHVAMVLIHEDSQKILLFQANGDGVSIAPLLDQIKFYSSCLTNMIALRKLETPTLNRCEINKKLLSFANQVKGKPYCLHPLKFVQKQEKWNEDKDFFCSELIARALQEAGLLNSSHRSSMFWPGCFGKDGKVEEAMKSFGGYLGEEILIDCTVPEIITSRSFSPRKEKYEL